MFRIYITAKALANVYLQEHSKGYAEQNDWFHILLKQQKIFTVGYTEPLGDVIEEEDFSDSAIIAEMSTAYNIQFIPSDNYINEVIRDNSRVYDQPNSAFFIDIDGDVANHIQNNYGVICQPASTDVDTTMFTSECLRFEYVKNKDVKGGWQELFEVQSSVPSNALCIIDRFLFAYDGQNNTNQGYESEITYNGLDTVLLILNSALPKIFKNTYHVTIICEKKQIKNRMIFQTLQQELFYRIKSISNIKGYPILAQLIAVDDDLARYTHSLTHNRQIISNYHKMSFQNGINAIRFYNGSEGNAEYTQTVQGELLYSSGLKHYKSECPEDSIRATQIAMKSVLKKWNNSFEPGHYYYADNLGNSSIRNFQNRLFS